MKTTAVLRAEEEARRFLSTVDRLRESGHLPKSDAKVSEACNLSGNSLTAATRRASMDLTKALARLRSNV